MAWRRVLMRLAMEISSKCQTLPISMTVIYFRLLSNE